MRVIKTIMTWLTLLLALALCVGGVARAYWGNYEEAGACLLLAFSLGVAHETLWRGM